MGKLLVSVMVSLGLLLGTLGMVPGSIAAYHQANETVSSAWAELPAVDDNSANVTYPKETKIEPTYAPVWAGRTCRHDTGTCVDTRTQGQPDEDHAYAPGHCPGPRYVQCHYNIYATGSNPIDDDWIGLY